MNIKFKLISTVTGLSLIIIAMFCATWYVTSKQKNDSLVINLAGRQRMLTQKLAKELLQFQLVRERTGRADTRLAEQVRATAGLFDKTLNALISSGKVPLSTKTVENEEIFLPAAKGKALEQLKRVAKQWHDSKECISQVLSGRQPVEQALDTILQNSVSLLDKMNSAVTTMQRNAEKSVRFLITVQAVLVAVGVGAILFALITVRSIGVRLEKIRSFTEVFGNGNLTAKAGISGSDELGQIGTSLENMAKNLRLIIHKISENAKSLDSSSKDLFTISTHVSSETDEVSQRSSEVASAAGEMSSNMNTVAAAVEETSTNVSIMAEAVKEMTATFNRITKNTENARQITEKAVSQSQHASDRVNELGTAASEIDKVTETITEISEQTNLLALNATIEAARAGEAGKGFAVVANEIKELAKQTAEATKDIRIKIESIQTSTDVTVTEIGEIARIVKEVNEIVGGIATALEEQTATTHEITENIVQASEGIQEVTENVAHSSQTANEVAEAIEDVNGKAATISNESSRLSTNAEQLKKLARQLDDLVRKFTT
ncbi:methyl-accepting chemotaxis protein [Desulfolithobacter sp.]